MPCTSLYKGESGYSAYIRGLGHKQDEEASRQTNAMVRHNTLYHKGEQVDYQMNVISLHKEPVGKQLREGVDIVARNQTILLKSKEEFLQGAVPNTIKHFIADLPVWLSSTNIFFKESALGRFFHRVAMSVYVCMYLSLCLSLFM